MKKFLVDFCKLFSNCILIVAFVMASFLVLINLYHHRYISDTYSADFVNEESYKTYKQDLIEITSNFEKIKNIPGEAYNIYEAYTNCNEAIVNSKIYDMTNVKNISYKDIYDYNIELNKELKNECFIHFNSKIRATLSDAHKSSYEAEFKELFDTETEISLEVTYLQNRLLSNSSYYFQTYVMKTTIFDELSVDYGLTLINYNNFSKMLLNLSEWVVTEFGGAQ